MVFLFSIICLRNEQFWLSLQDVEISQFLIFTQRLSSIAVDSCLFVVYVVNVCDFAINSVLQVSILLTSNAFQSLLQCSQLCQLMYMLSYRSSVHGTFLRAEFIYVRCCYNKMFCIILCTIISDCFFIIQECFTRLFYISQLYLVRRVRRGTAYFNTKRQFVIIKCIAWIINCHCVDLCDDINNTSTSFSNLFLFNLIYS